MCENGATQQPQLDWVAREGKSLQIMESKYYQRIIADPMSNNNLLQEALDHINTEELFNAYKETEPPIIITTESLIHSKYPANDPHWRISPVTPANIAQSLCNEGIPYGVVTSLADPESESQEQKSIFFITAEYKGRALNVLHHPPNFILQIRGESIQQDISTLTPSVLANSDDYTPLGNILNKEGIAHRNYKIDKVLPKDCPIAVIGYIHGIRKKYWVPADQEEALREYIRSRNSIKESNIGKLRFFHQLPPPPPPNPPPEKPPPNPDENPDELLVDVAVDAA